MRKTTKRQIWMLVAALSTALLLGCSEGENIEASVNQNSPANATQSQTATAVKSETAPVVPDHIALVKDGALPCAVNNYGFKKYSEELNLARPNSAKTIILKLLAEKQLSKTEI